MVQAHEHVAGALVKPSRTEFKVIPVINFKQAGIGQSPEGGRVPFLTFVDEPGNERRIPCTPEIWRMVDGDPKPGRKPRDLTNRDGRRKFWIYAKKIGGGREQAVSLTDFPHSDFLYNRAAGIPEDAKDDLIVRVDSASGSLTIVSVPPGTRASQVEIVVRQMDKVDQLYPGQHLGEGVEVISVSGNLVNLTVPEAPERHGVGMGITVD